MLYRVLTWNIYLTMFLTCVPGLLLGLVLSLGLRPINDPMPLEVHLPLALISGALISAYYIGTPVIEWVCQQTTRRLGR